MTSIERVINYLNKTEIFYVTTQDGDKPKCRPFGFKMVYDNKIYFGVGTFKECYHQLMNNSNIEICASDGQGFLRYYGKAIFDDNPDILKKAFEIAPYLTNLYNKETNHKLGMFYIANATAEFRSLKGIEESVSI